MPRCDVQGSFGEARACPTFILWLVLQRLTSSPDVCGCSTDCKILVLPWVNTRTTMARRHAGRRTELRPNVRLYHLTWMTMLARHSLIYRLSSESQSCLHTDRT